MIILKYKQLNEEILFSLLRNKKRIFQTTKVSYGLIRNIHRMYIVQPTARQMTDAADIGNKSIVVYPFSLEHNPIYLRTHW